MSRPHGSVYGKFHLVQKYCLWCKALLKLRNTRDIERKKFCSRGCASTYTYSIGRRDMRKLWSKCNTPEANAKKRHVGTSHPRYIKDRSQVKYRPRYENTRWRTAVFERDSYTCQICFKVGGKLQADHIKPYAAYPEFRWILSNGRTLCVDCHKKTPTYGARGKRKLKEDAGADKIT